MVGIILLSRFPKGHPLCELDAHYLLLLQEGWAGLIEGTVWRLVRVAVDAPFELGGAVRSSMVSAGTLPTGFLITTELFRVSNLRHLKHLIGLGIYGRTRTLTKPTLTSRGVSTWLKVKIMLWVATGVPALLDLIRRADTTP